MNLIAGWYALCIRRPVMRLTAFFILTSALACSAADNVAGRWEGSIKIPGQELAAIIDLDQPNGNDCIGSITIPGLDVKGTPLADIAVTDAGISFTIKGALASERTDTPLVPRTVPMLLLSATEAL